MLALTEEQVPVAHIGRLADCKPHKDLQDSIAFRMNQKAFTLAQQYSRCKHKIRQNKSE